MRSLLRCRFCNKETMDYKMWHLIPFCDDDCFANWVMQYPVTTQAVLDGKGNLEVRRVYQKELMEETHAK